MEIVHHDSKSPNPKKKKIIRVIVAIVTVALLCFSVFFFDLIPDFKKKDPDDLKNKEVLLLYENEGIKVEDLESHNVKEVAEVQSETGLQDTKLLEEYNNLKDTNKNSAIPNNSGNQNGNNTVNLINNETATEEIPVETPVTETPIEETPVETPVTETPVEIVPEKNEIPNNILIALSTESIKNEMFLVNKAFYNSYNNNKDPFNEDLLFQIFNALGNGTLSELSNIDNISFGEWLDIVQNWLFYSKNNTQFKWIMVSKSPDLYKNIVRGRLFDNDFSGIKNQAISKKGDSYLGNYIVNFQMIFTNNGSTYKAYFGIENDVPKLLDILKM